MEYAVGSFIVLIGVFVVFTLWRYASVARGMRRRDAAILEKLGPVAVKLDAKAHVSEAEVAALTAVPQNRPLLLQILDHYDRLDLYPKGLLSHAAQGEGLLAYWMLHPNEFGEAPAAIELVEEVARVVNEKPAKFFVYRFRLPAGHWAEGEGWLLGFAGPFFAEDEPYSPDASGFARASDGEGKVTPSALIDGWLRTIKAT
ncbi:MAG TPA: hypothetical protein VNC50_00640 [Planctomycetia bacterium]|nr:hypothetical protein [Planctomycetia bacterium]